MKNLLLIATMLITVIAPAQNDELFHDNLNYSLFNGETEILFLADNTTINNRVSVSNNSTAIFAYTEEEDCPLELENWMTNEPTFEMAVVPFEIETEESLFLEEWMITVSEVDVTITPMELMPESQLVLENWMVEIDGFEKNTSTNEEPETPLLLEAWMINSDNWECSSAIANL